MIRVFLADDHPIVRTGLRYLLSTADDIEVVGEAADGRAVLTAAEAPDWPVDVLVLDISLPKLNGIEVLRRLTATRPALPVLMLSMYAEDQYARRLVADGAAGYVSKDRSEVELIGAIRAVANGMQYISRRAANSSAERPEQAGHHAFSPRQHQIFTRLVEGHPVTDIAAELNVTVSTVSTHVGHIKRRLGVRSIAEIVSYAHRMNLTE